MIQNHSPAMIHHSIEGRIETTQLQETSHRNKGYNQNQITSTPRSGSGTNTTSIEIIQAQWTQTEEFLTTPREQHNQAHVTSVNNLRPNRVLERKTGDPLATAAFGDSIWNSKQETCLRLFHQNVKGLTYTAGGEDYEYYMHSLKELDIDICGMSETNTPWQHHYLTQEFTTRARRHRDMVKIEFGSPDPTVDSVPATETFQAGGSLTIAMDTAVTILAPGAIKDNTGLGRWSGLTLRGKKNQYLTIITAYRTCGGTINTANIGGTFSREYEHFRMQGYRQPNP
jgi:hypothetical protein